MSSRRRTPIVEAVERVLPAVVNIGTEQIVRVVPTDPVQRFRAEVFDRLFGDMWRQPPMTGYQVRHSLGSGVIVDSLGYILTNFHVVERATVIRVTLVDGRLFTARLVAADELNDLALLKIDPPEPLAEVRFAKDNDLMLGEPVIALGNPFGLAHTVTVGVLSACNREARYGDQVLFRDILQTDAAVNPGSSGGPLINADGELIGINVAIHQEAQNIGFAVPVQRVRALLTHWLSPRTMKTISLAMDVAEQDGKLRVTSVDPGGVAERAGVRVGDRVMALNGMSLSSLLEYYRALLRVQPGDTLTLTLVSSDDRPKVARLVVAPYPRPDGAALAWQRLGLELAPPEPDDPIRGGLRVVRVRPGGPADRAGVRPGHRIARLAGRAVTSLDEVGAVLEPVRPGEVVPVSVAAIETGEGILIARTQTIGLTTE